MPQAQTTSFASRAAARMAASLPCKKKNRKDGKTQLQNYLTFSKAALGVWFNGDERIFLRKIEKDGKIEFEEIPNIPQFGQRI
ncbi:MAG TPA: hypothetical protein VF442_06285, partial [Sphingobium sp.]